MIIIGSAILFAFGLLLLFVQAIRIAFSLLKLAYYLIKFAVYLAVLVVCVVGLGVQYLMRWLKPKPVVTVYSDEEDIPTIDLLRTHFHRL
jgi:hypothetical protein